MLYLGTGASEMIPNSMRGCPLCRQALTSSDHRNKRCRSAFMLDEKTLIDCGPEMCITEAPQVDIYLSKPAWEGRHKGSFAGENSLHYLFHKDGKTMFYACDTGLFFPETMEYLKRFYLDALVIELAFGKAALPETGRQICIRAAKYCPAGIVGS